MRVDDQARKSVVFVGARDGDRFTLLGTGFLASVRYQTVPLIPLVFVVTADHVVEQIAGDNIAVRLNRKSGDVFTVTLEKKNKLPALDKDADLPIFFLPTPIPDDCDHTSVLLDRSEFKAICARGSSPDRPSRPLQWPVSGGEGHAFGVETSLYGLRRGRSVNQILTKVS